MSFLILDTDKRSTASLRLQLGAIGDGRIGEAPDAQAYARLRTRRLPPPDVVLLDQDGDPGRVESFRQEIQLGNPTSVVLYLGTDPASSMPRPQDSYLRKPVFGRKLEHALIAGYARGQNRCSGVGYLGEGAVPAGLVREIAHARFWTQLVRVDASSLGSPKHLAGLGAIFIEGKIHTEAIGLLARIGRFTSASRIILIGIGNSPEETRELRDLADYFIPAEADWKSILENLASRRLNRLGSELALQQIRFLSAVGKTSACKRELEALIRSDPWNLKAHGRMADLEFSLARYPAAGKNYRRILELNPCQPRAYFRLLEIEKGSAASSEQTLSVARSYCPKLPEIQGEIQKYWEPK